METKLARKKWVLGGSALFLLYAGLHSGGILFRLGLLIAATGCFVLWSRSKQQLELLGADLKTAPQKADFQAPVLEVQEVIEELSYFAKMPVRYPRPVYIHKGGFELQRH
jgi:hypothetical protein